MQRPAEKTASSMRRDIDDGTARRKRRDDAQLITIILAATMLMSKPMGLRSVRCAAPLSENKAEHAAHDQQADEENNDDRPQQELHHDTLLSCFCINMITVIGFTWRMLACAPANGPDICPIHDPPQRSCGRSVLPYPLPPDAGPFSFGAAAPDQERKLPWQDSESKRSGTSVMRAPRA
jgi:hypothetical protein